MPVLQLSAVQPLVQRPQAAREGWGQAQAQASGRVSACCWPLGGPISSSPEWGSGYFCEVLCQGPDYYFGGFN